MKRVVCGVGLVLALVAAGCGGGGGGTPVTPNPSFRAGQIGDSAAYSVTGRLSVNGGQSVPVSGTATALVQTSRNRATGRATFDDLVRAFDERQTITLQVSGQPIVITWITWAGVDSAGSLYFLGDSDDGSTWRLVADVDLPLATPAVLSTSSVWSYTAHMDDGSTDTASYNVVGVERLTTPAGTLATFKVRFTESSTAQGAAAATGYAWIAPELGLSVKEEGDMTFSDGTDVITGHLTLSLQSYQLAGTGG